MVGPGIDPQFESDWNAFIQDGVLSPALEKRLDEDLALRQRVYDAVLEKGRLLRDIGLAMRKPAAAT